MHSNSNSVASFPRRYNSAGFATGSDFNKTACTKVKIEVVAPMPSASVRIVVTVNAGAIRSRRSAWRVSSINVSRSGNPL